MEKLACWISLGIAAFALGGCVSPKPGVHGPPSYKVQAVFISPADFATMKPEETVEVITQLGHPFSVQTEDRAGNRYYLKGTLAAAVSNRFDCSGIHYGYRAAGGEASSDAAGSKAAELGHGDLVGAILSTSIVGPLEGLTITRQ